MKKLLLIGLLLLTTQCEARTFGCFMGVLGAENSQNFTLVYNNRELFEHKKTSMGLLPFIGCGVSFDF